MLKDMPIEKWFPFVVVYVAIDVFVFCAVINLLIGVLKNKLTFEAWLQQQKYMLLFYCGALSIILLLSIMVHYSVKGVLVALPVAFLGLTAVLLINKRRQRTYAEEGTSNYCACGNQIVRVVLLKPSGKRVTVYYTCRHCQIYFSKARFEPNNRKFK